MRKYLRIPTVFGTATGTEALKCVNHLIHETSKRYVLSWALSAQYDKTYARLKRLRAEKEAIIEKIEMIKANRTDYGVLGKEYQIRNKIL